RKLKNVVEIIECRRQRDSEAGSGRLIECAYLVGRKQGSVAGAVGQAKAPAATLLPSDPKTAPGGTVLPCHGVIQLKAAAGVKGGDSLSKSQAGGGNRDQRRADGDASGAVRRLRRELVVAEEEVRKTEIVDEVWAEDAGDTKQALIGP